MPDFNNMYQSPQRRAQFAKYGLIAGAVLSVLSILASVLSLRQLSNGVLPQEDEFTLTDGFQLFVGLAMLGVYIATIILFLLWFHRVSRNLKPLGVRDQQHSPGWAVGCWFVPFANLFIPYRIAKEIWFKSDTDTDDYGFLKADSSAPSFLGMWWGFWIVSNIVENASARFSFRSTSIGDLSLSEWLGIFGSVLSIIATIFVLRVIQDITARQEASAAQLPNYGAPPPPPTYGANA